MTIDGYEVYLEDEQLELYESATKEDIPIDLSVWIRVMLSDEDGIFDPTEDYVLCNVTFLGKISDFEQEMKEVVKSEQFQKEAQFNLHFDGLDQQ